MLTLKTNNGRYIQVFIFREFTEGDSRPIPLPQRKRKFCLARQILYIYFCNRPEDIQEVWFEEPNDMIRGMAALSSAVGLSKSFSTSDIINLPDSCMGGGEEEGNIAIGADHNSLLLLLNGTRRNTVSELALSSIQNSGYLLEQSIKLQNSSRSCSTWVAVGDIPSTSQLPSPHGGNLPTTLQSSKPSYIPAFSPVDLVRSVNKKVITKSIFVHLQNNPSYK